MIRIFITKALFILTFTINAQTTIPVSIHSNTSHVLYANCSNSIAITLLPCTGTFSVKSVMFTADDAAITIDSILNNTFFLTIIPNDSLSKITLNSYDGRSLLNTESFVVKRLPIPEIHLLTQGKQIDVKNGLYGIPRDLSIEAVLDRNVQHMISLNPKYKITDFEIQFVKSGKYLAKINKKSDTIDLRTIKNIESTEYIIITINEIKIIMPDGELKTIKFGSYMMTIPVLR